MFCPKCGAQVPDGTKFCPSCGASLAGNSGSAAPAAQNSQGAAPQQFNQSHQSGGAQQYQSQGVNYTPMPTQPKKSNKGLIAGLVAAAVVVVIAAVLIFTNCSSGGGKNEYVGTWEGSATYQGISIDCTLTLNDDQSAEMEVSFVGQSESTDGLQWRETAEGVEVATEGRDDWEEFERDGDSLVMSQNGIEIELTKQ